MVESIENASDIFPQSADVERCEEQEPNSAQQLDLSRTAPVTNPTRAPVCGHLLQLWGEGEHRNLAGNITHLAWQLSFAQLEALSSSLRALVARHRILAARVEEDERGIHLFIDERFVPEIQVIDLRHSSATNHWTTLEKRAGEIAYECVWRPFEFDIQSRRSGPLMRSFLIILSDERSIFGIVVNHVLADFMALVIIGRDMRRFYDNYLSGKASRYPPLRISFMDYLINLDAWLQSSGGQSATAHWKARIGNTPQFRLPPDAQPPPTPSAPYGVLAFKVTSAAFEPMRTYARQQHSTLFILFLVAQFASIMKVSGKTHGLINVVHLGREQPRLYNLVGCFGSYVPFRIAMRSTCTFAEVVADVTRRWGEDSTELSRCSLSAAEGYPGFNFVDYPTDAGAGPFSVPYPIPWPEPSGERSDRYYLDMVLERRCQGWHGLMFYRNDLHAERTIKEFVVDILALLNLAIYIPDQSLDQLLSSIDLPQYRKPFEGVFQ